MFISALLKASGCLNLTPTSALEVLTNVLPIRLRLQELLCYEYIRLPRKEDNNPIRAVALYDQNNIKATSFPQLILPAQKMLYVIRPTARRINLSDMDRDPKYDPDLLCCRSFSRKALSLDQLGNSKTRTDEQDNKAQTVAAEYINNISKNSLICFTDGSALRNPSPCGAGAAVSVDSTLGAPVLLKRPVAKKSISYHGELAAIEFAQSYDASHQNLKKIVILSDCQAAINTVCNHEYPSNFTNIICKINEKIKDPCNKTLLLKSYG